MNNYQIFQQEFHTKNYASIDFRVFFKDKFIEIENLINKFHESEWSYIIKNHIREFDYSINDKNKIETNRKIALQDYANELFSFAFKRIVNNSHLKSKEIFDKIYSFFSSDLFLDFLSSLTNRKLSKINENEFYITKFEKGDFLTTHCDPGQSIGIALNMTQKWNANFGGHTFILDKNRENILETLVPTSGKLLVFDTLYESVPHFVSMVTAHTAYPRISIVTRYHEYK